MAQQKVNAEMTLLQPSALIELFELDGTNVGMTEVLYFYAGTNYLFQPVVYNGISYTPFALEATDFELDGKGSLPRPKIRVSNIRGIISNYLLKQTNLIGARFVRRRVFVKYLDAVNFPGGVNPWGTADPTATVSEDIFFVNRKIQENTELIEFELATPLEVDNVKLPKRPIYAIICPFKYRNGGTCTYSGIPLTDKSNRLFSSASGGYGFTLVDQGEWNESTTYNEGDYVYVASILPQNYGQRFYFVCSVNGTVGAVQKPTLNFTNWIADNCSRSILGCKLHFPSGPLPFGGFPGVSRSRFIDR